MRNCCHLTNVSDVASRIAPGGKYLEEMSEVVRSRSSGSYLLHQLFILRNLATLKPMSDSDFISQVEKLTSISYCLTVIIDRTKRATLSLLDFNHLRKEKKMSMSGPSNTAVLTHQNKVWSVKRKQKREQVKEIVFDENARWCDRPDCNIS